MPPAKPVFFTRHGHVVVPAADAVIKPRRGVFALAVVKGLALFVEQNFTHGCLELPGGGVEAGETLDQAMRREWDEETGLPFHLQGPKRDYSHIRGFYAENLNEFWVYEQTFRLYDYSGEAEAGMSWPNQEQGKACWREVADFDSMRIHAAHAAGIAELIKN